jgi:YHS domain-containing protein
MLIAAAMVVALVGGCAQTEQAEEAATEQMEEAAEGETAEMAAETVTCPVCGTEAAKEDAITYEYEGTTYYFCSEECRDTFVEDPAAYMMHEEEMPAEEVPAEGETGTS